MPASRLSRRTGEDGIAECGGECTGGIGIGYQRIAAQEFFALTRAQFFQQLETGGAGARRRRVVRVDGAFISVGADQQWYGSFMTGRKDCSGIVWQDSAIAAQEGGRAFVGRNLDVITAEQRKDLRRACGAQLRKA